LILLWLLGGVDSVICWIVVLVVWNPSGKRDINPGSYTQQRSMTAISAGVQLNISVSCE
jgi:hypothetical protein